MIEEEKDLSEVSTKEQREEIESAAKETEEWLEEVNPQKVTVTDFNQKLSYISSKAEPVFHRYSELTQRPAAIKKLREYIDKVKESMKSWSEKLPQITVKEIEQMSESIKKVETWIETKLEAQAATNPTSEPVFDSSEVLPQLKPVQAIFDRLIRKPKPPPEKV